MWVIDPTKGISNFIVTSGFVKNFKVEAQQLGGPLMLIRGLNNLSEKVTEAMLVRVNFKVSP